MIKVIKNKRGFALVSSVAILIFVILFAVAYFREVNSGLAQATTAADTKRAYYIANAGLTDAFMQLRSYTSNPPSSFAVYDNNYPVGNKTGSYSAAVLKTNATWPTFTITSTGTYNNVGKTLVLTVEQTAVSMSAYLSNSEIDPTYGRLWWITGMLAVGPVHTNGQFNIYGNPVFDGPVSQVSPAINYYAGGPPNDNPDFKQGLSLSAPSQAVFSDSIINNISLAASSSGGLYLSGNSTIAFKSDGTMNVTNSAKHWNKHNMALPSNKAIYVKDGSVTVSGVVNGQVTVGTNNDIFIKSHLLYNSDPRDNSSSTDLLSLVAKEDIIVTTAAPDNLEIDAVLVAVNGSFEVDRFWEDVRGDMVLYGSLINNICGPTGIFDSSTGILYGGYNLLQYYDTRLRALIPPWFPPTVDSNDKIVYSKVNFKEL